MPVTLAQAQLNTQEDIDFAVIDNLRRYSWLFDQIVFDDTVSPGTGAGTLVYGYTRLKTARSAGFRRFNEEYTPGQAERERLTVELHPLGGSYNIDRTLARLGPQSSNEVTFQMQQLITSARNRFQDELINGDTAVDSAGFDGLDKSLTGTTTEYNPLAEGVSAGYVDWTAGTINTQALAMAQLDKLDDWLSRLTPSTVGGGDLGTPGALPPGVHAILGNTKSITRVRALARWAGIYTAEKDDLGRKIEMYGDWALVDVGDNATGAAPIIPIEGRDADGAGGGGVISGLTDLYAVSFGMDALHGASVAGVPLVQSWMPDYNTAGAVKTGEIEIGPVAAVLKNTKCCGVFRNVKVQ